MEITQRHINQNGRNIPAPVSRFSVQSTEVTTAFLFLPVDCRKCPSIDLRQTTETAAFSLRIRTEHDDMRVLIKPSSEVMFSVAATTESVSVPHLSRWRTGRCYCSCRLAWLTEFWRRRMPPLNYGRGVYRITPRRMSIRWPSCRSSTPFKSGTPTSNRSARPGWRFRVERWTWFP